MTEYLNDHNYLKDLAERLMHVPAMYGTDGYDVDRLTEIAKGMTVNPAGKVSGYTAQPDAKVALVNEFKADEERLLRKIDAVMAELRPNTPDNPALDQPAYDRRWAAVARTHFQEGFMALNRAVFQPQRIRLPEDDAE